MKKGDTMKVFILIAAIVLTSCTIPTTYIWYHDKWMTEKEYAKALEEEQVKVTIVLTASTPDNP